MVESRPDILLPVDGVLCECRRQSKEAQAEEEHPAPSQIGRNYLEDLVAHCGGTVTGSYISSLVVTDVCSGWMLASDEWLRAQGHSVGPNSIRYRCCTRYGRRSRLLPPSTRPIRRMRRKVRATVLFASRCVDLGSPVLTTSDHRIKYGQKLSHAGRQRQLLRLPCFQKPLVKGS